MPAPAGLYLHIPFCAQKCPYCDFYSVPLRAEMQQRYVEALCRNIAALPKDTLLDTVYFGGGTPSLLPDTAVARILETAASRCVIAADAEITLEANPLTLIDKRLHALKDAGVNRLSIGMQSTQAEVLHILGRKHTPEQGIAAVHRAYDAGFANLSVDLMLGLPCQTEETFAETLKTVAALPVQHISAYLLQIEDGTPFGKHPPETLSPDEQAVRYLQMDAALTAAEFSHYEISNFARAGFESRHNCKYWRCDPFYGIGAAAHGCIAGRRYAVPRDVTAFCNAPLQPEETLDNDACGVSEQIMLGLRHKEGIDLADFPAHRKMLMRKAEPLIPQYLTLSGSRLSMTPEGWLLSNAVLTRILP